MLKLNHQKNTLEAGVDEAGRGCLAGPVVAAAVILPAKRLKWFSRVNDSKKLCKSMRNELRLLVEQDSLAWAVGFADHSEIDNINILNATYLAMHRAIAQLKIVPQCLLIDGNRFKPYGDINHHCIVEGDGKYLSIAAASVLAKTHRDEYMLRLHDEFPHYGWNSNKAYGTIMHREAIGKHGISPYHRMSFSFLPITSVVENDETSINNCM